MRKPKSKKSRAFGWALELILVLALLALLHWWQARDLSRGPAPQLLGMSLSGEPLSLSNYTGQPVLVHFWATWCPICRFEEGGIDRIAHDHTVLSVATTSGNAEELRAYMDAQGLNFTVLLDEHGAEARRWGVHGVPATFIIDSAGNIDYATKGYSSEWGLRLRLALAD